MPIGIIIIVVLIWGVAMFRAIRSYQLEKERVYLFEDYGFNEDKKVITDDEMHMVCVDLENRKWSYYDNHNKHSQIFEFNQLIDYEITENGNSILQGRTGSTLVGGVLLGGIGALAGAVRSKKINEICTELQIKLFVNDISNSCIIIDLINGSTKKNSKNYQESLNKAIEFESILKIIIANSRETTEVTNRPPDITKSKKEQLQELKEMLDSDLITAEDYEQKKKQILGL